MNGKSSEDAAGCGRHHSIPSSIWFLGIKITRLETTLTRWVPHVESQTREISIIYITVIYHLSLDRCCFLSINYYVTRFFCWFLIGPWSPWPKNCWGAAELNRSDTLVSTNQGTLLHPIFQRKSRCCCKVAVGNGDANLTMVLSSSSGSRQSGTYATWLSSEVSASGSWKSSYSNNRTILQYTSEMFCTSAMF